MSYLSHHGIRGQKWGKRNGPPYPLSSSKRSAAERKGRSPLAKTENQNSSTSTKKGLSDSQKKALKIGAAIAVTALAAYGGYKLYQAYGGKTTSIINNGKKLETNISKEMNDTVIRQTDTPKSSESFIRTPSSMTFKPKPEYDDNFIKQLKDGGVNIDEIDDLWECDHTLTSNDWIKSLSEDESESIRSYCGFGFSWTNRALRSNTIPSGYSKEEWAKETGLLDNVLDRYELKQNTEFTRYVSTDLFGGAGTKEDLEKLIGNVVHDDGYCSASFGGRLGDIANYPIKCLVKTPAGKGIGAYIADISQSPRENEFLFNRGSEFEIAGVSVEDGKTVVELLYKGLRRAAVG